MTRKHLLPALLLASLAGTASALPTQWTTASGGNDHYYEYIAGEFDWGQAFNDAAERTWLGETGYLATVTSAEENAFLVALSTDLGWLGGSDAGAEINEFSWRTGPEAGQVLTYTHWNSGEPNNCCGGENYLQINWGGPGGWNDHGGPGNPGQLNGYFLEFNAPVPEPETHALLLAGLGIVIALARRRARG